MQSALKLSTLLLCLSLTIGEGRSNGPAAGHTLLAGCPATAIVCPSPKPAADDTPAPPPKKGQKSGKG